MLLEEGRSGLKTMKLWAGRERERPKASADDFIWQGGMPGRNISYGRKLAYGGGGEMGEAKQTA